MSLEKPNPPVVGKVTHFNIYLEWTHVKTYLPPKKRYRFKLEESSINGKYEWTGVYTGYGFCTTITGLQPSTEYSYRLCLSSPDNNRSDFSQPIIVKTTKEPINGELFHKAIFLDNKKEISNMLDSPNGEKLFSIPDRLGNLPLMMCIVRDNVEMIDLLIERGCKVDEQNESKKTALMLAAFYGKLNLVKTLRQYEADYNKKDNTGMTPLHYAIDGGNCDTIEYMVTDGANINAQDSTNGWTPLLRGSSLNAKADVARVLTKYECDLNVLDINGKNALMIATINGNLPFVQVLVTHGADLYKLNEYGKSLYELAIAMDRRTIIKYFDDWVDQNNIKNFKLIT